MWDLGPMEAEGQLFGGVWGGGALPLQRGGLGGRQPPQRKMVPGAIANSEIRNPEGLTWIRLGSQPGLMLGIQPDTESNLGPG